MGSAFFGLNVSTQGLYTAQTALDIVNHNISNAELKGYSRQYAEIKASRALPNSSRGMIGTGAEVLSVKQYRSSYLDNKYWGMSTDLGQYTVKEEMLSQLELLLQEPSDSGYATRFADVFDSLQE
jgi:flagellar hook-associated protein 1 FlgK